MEKIRELLREGKSPSEIIKMGFARSTVYAVKKQEEKKVDILSLEDRVFTVEEAIPHCWHCSTTLVAVHYPERDAFSWACPKCGRGTPIFLLSTKKRILNL